MLEVDLWDLFLTRETSQIKGKVKRAGELKKKKREKKLNQDLEFNNRLLGQYSFEYVDGTSLLKSAGGCCEGMCSGGHTSATAPSSCTAFIPETPQRFTLIESQDTNH